MEFLKELLGEDLYAQVADKLQGSNVKLADLSTGEYVSKRKFDAMETRAKTAEGNLSSIEAADVEGHYATEGCPSEYAAILKADHKATGFCIKGT